MVRRPFAFASRCWKKPSLGRKNQHQGIEEKNYSQSTELGGTDHPVKELNQWSTNRDDAKNVSPLIYDELQADPSVDTLAPVTIGLSRAMGTSQ